MSGQVPPTGPGALGAPGGQGEQPSEEEIRAYLAQLRQADVSEVIAQTFSMLASAAEVKLGRRDARLLIDAAAAIDEAVGETVDQRLTEQMTQVLAQLRSAQVDAEGQLDQMRSEGRLPAEEEGDLPAGAEEEPSGGEEPRRTQAQEQGPGGSSAASKLWIPGR
jgi:hypothetical protein